MIGDIVTKENWREHVGEYVNVEYDDGEWPFVKSATIEADPNAS